MRCQTVFRVTRSLMTGAGVNLNVCVVPGIVGTNIALGKWKLCSKISLPPLPPPLFTQPESLPLVVFTFLVSASNFVWFFFPFVSLVRSSPPPPPLPDRSLWVDSSVEVVSFFWLFLLPLF